MFRSSEPLSNTLTTYPQDEDNPGKLGLSPDRRRRLEWSVVQSKLRMWSTRLRMGLRLIR